MESNAENKAIPQDPAQDTEDTELVVIEEIPVQEGILEPTGVTNIKVIRGNKPAE